MRPLSSSVFLVLLIALPIQQSLSEDAGSMFKQLANAIMADNDVKTLQESLYPINNHKKSIVNITYKFLMSKESFSDVTEYLNSHSGVCFHWLSSPVHLNINDQLLHGLALQTYIPEVSKLTLHVDMAHFNETDIKNIYTDLMRIDGLHNDSRILCNESNTLLDVLNDFTAYVSANPVMFTLRIS